MLDIKDFLEKNRGKTSLLEHEVKGLLKDIGFSIPKGIFVDKKKVEQIPAIIDI